MATKPLFGGKTREFIAVLCAVILVMTVAFLIEPSPGSLRSAKYNVAMQTARQIGQILFTYSVDHNGHYPEGKTSTEIFQHLIDEKYVTDPQICYFEWAHIPEKVRPLSNHLKEENVCWDVTCCIDSSAPDGLPAVFLTGYKVTYKAGAAAIPINPLVERTWLQWWSGTSDWKPFIAVFYKGNSAKTIVGDKDGSIPNFILADFDPKGKTYRQLTP